MSPLPSQPKSSSYDAIIVGSGPNGLAAGITLCRAGLNVLMVEAQSTIGGGTRTAELTLPGFHHDVCSAVHPLGIASPFFRSVAAAGNLVWNGRTRKSVLAHPLTDGRAAVMHQDVGRTAEGLPDVDRKAYQKFYGSLQSTVSTLLPELLGPLVKFPKHPFRMASFGLQGMQSAVGLARRKFVSEEAQALFAGHAAHSILPLEQSFTAAVGIMLSTTGHLVGWPVAKGGSQSIANAMGHYFEALGGEIVVNCNVESLDALPKAKAYLFDTGPRALASICATQLPERYRGQLQKYRYGPGAFKLDLALSGPIPWLNPDCRRAGTVHVGGTIEEMIASEKACWKQRMSDRPFVLLAQQSVADPSRAPAGKHTCWAYCHTPPGFTEI